MNDHDKPEPQTTADRLGLVVSGSLAGGLDVRLDSSRSVEEMAVGRYVTVQGRRSRFFGIITDVELRAANRDIPWSLPEAADDFAREVMAGTTTFGSLHVVPYLKVGPTADAQPEPAKTVPAHFAEVRQASQEDVERIFGQEDESHFVIGSPLDMEVKVCLNYQRFAERSNGVFGKSGTGKTFLARIVLASLIQKSNAQREAEKRVVNLVFDMHNEYGWSSQDEAKREIKGLRQLFPTGQVSCFTLDEPSSRRRGSKVDGVVRIGYDQIEPEDVDGLSSLMALSDVQVGALYFLRRRLGQRWVARLLDEEDPLEELEGALERGTIHGGTLGAIQRKLGMFRRFEFLQERVSEDPVRQILDYLDRGVNITLEFGRYGNSLEAYLLVANYITRRIHTHYVRRKEEALGEQGKEPRPLVITIEEAHKFLDPTVARHTILAPSPASCASTTSRC